MSRPTKPVLQGKRCWPQGVGASVTDGTATLVLVEAAYGAPQTVNGHTCPALSLAEPIAKEMQTVKQQSSAYMAQLVTRAANGCKAPGLRCYLPGLQLRLAFFTWPAHMEIDGYHCAASLLCLRHAQWT